jgi:hypothetical protein
MTPSPYDRYRQWCESIGVPPASEEKYERTVEYGRDRVLCGACGKQPVKVVGNTCPFCMCRGQAPNNNLKD